jgi:hypothetical protein
MMRWGFVVVVCCGLLGCQGGRAVVPVRLGPAELAAPTDPRLLVTHDEAVRGISAILVREFKLPVPEQVTVYVYGSRRVFEEGLVRDAHLSPARASELSASALGVGRPRQLLFHDVTSERGREWLRLVAHELVHVCQIELAGGDRGGAQWLKEGMADWVAFGVLERLRIDSLARRRLAALDGVRRSVPAHGEGLDLEGLGSAAGFSAHSRTAAAPTYQLAFLMVDRLVQRGGFERVVEYFRTFTESDDRRQNFERVFGLSVPAFEREMLDEVIATTR